MTKLKDDETTETVAQEAEEENLDVIGGDSKIRSNLAKEYKVAQDAMRYFALDWDEYEDLLFVQGRTSDNSRTRLSEGSLSTIVIERAGRVMSQLPIGSVNALGLQDQGKGLLMDLVLEKYIYPNANEQYDLETKLFLWDAYSNVYGTMAMCYDWEDNENYTGPTCWLVPMRNFFPQQGRLSVRDCDFVFISTFQPRQKLADIVDDELEDYDLDAIQEILDETKHGGTKPKARDDYLRVNPMFQYRRRSTFTDTGDIEVVTKYEAGEDGRWIDFVPDYGNRVIRNIPNPHQNGKIPVVLKFAFPTLDSVMGLGDMEKGRYMQYAMDTTINLQIDAQKLRTYPPIKVVNGNVVMPTLRFQPGAKWLVSNPNDVSHHQFPDLDNNLNQSYQFLKGALTNVTGNSTTQTSAESNSPTQGKTPAAIKSMGQSQSTRDEIDMKFMVKAIEELFGNMINLINDVEHKKPIELYMFNDEIQQIAQDYPDIADAVKLSKNGKTAKITIKPSRIKNEKGYLYKIDPTSTRQQDDEAEHQQLLEIFQTMVDNPGVVEQQLQMSGMTIDFSQFYQRLLQTGGLRDWKQILKPMPQATPPGQQGASLPGQPGSPGQPQGGAAVPAEAINIKDLPPAGAVQMAAQAGIQLTPQDFEQQASQKEQLKTQGQIAVKKVAPAPVQPQEVQHTVVTPGTHPDIAQAQAQILAQHESLRSNLQNEVQGG